MLKRTAKLYYSKLNQNLEQTALKFDRMGNQQAAITLLDQSDRLLKQLKTLPRDKRKQLKKNLKTARA